MKLPAGFQGALGLFGGTFDPVHNGHLRTAYELRERLELERVHFIPAAQPPHKMQPETSAELRLKMLEAAVGNDQAFVADRCELDRDGPSWTVDTAQYFRAKFPDRVLCLLLGMDAFVGLTSWHRWESLLQTVNVVVARRPGAELPSSGELGRLLARQRTDPLVAESWAEAGQIIVQDVTQLEISASALRASIRAGLQPRYLVPDAVWNIIRTSGCYAL